MNPLERLQRISGEDWYWLFSITLFVVVALFIATRREVDDEDWRHA